MPVSKKNKKIAEALSVLVDLGMPRAQQNERSALALLALLDLSPGKEWSEAQDPLMGITPFRVDGYNQNYPPAEQQAITSKTLEFGVYLSFSLGRPAPIDSMLSWAVLCRP